MKYIPRTIFATILILGLASCSSTLYDSKWQPKPIIADGDATDWSLPLRFYDSESGLQYAVTNNETTLFVCIRSTESDMQMKILSSGLTISMDATGKNKKTSVINFPLPLPGVKGHSPSMQNNEMKKPDNQGKKQKKTKPLEVEPGISLSGFADGYNGTFKAGEVKGIEAAMNFDPQNALTLELAIPLAALPSKTKITDIENPVIGFLINVAASEIPGGENTGGDRMQGGPPKGGGAGIPGQGGAKPGGGNGGGRGMSGTPPDRNLQQGENKSSSTKIKFRIKLKNNVNQ